MDEDTLEDKDEPARVVAEALVQTKVLKLMVQILWVSSPVLASFNGDGT